MPLRKVMDAIFYVLRTGCQWKALPPEYGSGSTAHRYFQAWRGRGVFEQLWKEALEEYDELRGIAWREVALDGAMTKAPLGGEKNGAQPHRPSQGGDQAVAAHRPAGSAVGHRGRGGQPA